jgi:hypothetical protein
MTVLSDTAGFYFDPEILGQVPAAPEHPPVWVAPNFFAYLHGTSASAATFSPALDTVPSRSSTPPRSFPEIGISRTRPGELPTVTGTGTVRSEQIGEFWERYGAYPRYLKNLTKRKKRKQQKVRIGSVQEGSHE